MFRVPQVTCTDNVEIIDCTVFIGLKWHALPGAGAGRARTVMRCQADPFTTRCAGLLPMIDLVKARIWIRDRIVRMGVGPLRKPAQLIEAYARFGDWTKLRSWDHAFKNRYAIFDYLNTSILHQGPIDYLEFGVYQGESIRYWSQINRCTTSRFFGFDCFEGLPEDWHGSALGNITMGKSSFNAGGTAPVIDDQRVNFVKGYFQDTLPGFLDRFQPLNRLVIHMDADLYSSTLYVLCSLDRLITKDTLIMFDEFASINHEFRALVDYATSFRRKYSVVAYTSSIHQVAIRIDE
jgi:O-methyltransferase